MGHAVEKCISFLCKKLYHWIRDPPSDASVACIRPSESNPWDFFVSVSTAPIPVVSRAMARSASFEIERPAWYHNLDDVFAVYALSYRSQNVNQILVIYLHLRYRFSVKSAPG